MHQGYQGNWCFWENDHIIDIYRLHQGYPGNLHNFWKLGNIIPTYRLHQGYQGSWSSFWENDHIIAIYRLHRWYSVNWYKFCKCQYIIAIYWLHLGYKICIMAFYYTKDTWVTDVHFGNFPTSTIFSFLDVEWSISWTGSLNQLLFEPVIL